MQALKKNWYVIVIFLITVGLGVVTFLTSQQLTKTTPVAPNVPQATPKAAAPACTLTFALATLTGTPTVTLTPTATPTNTPTSTPSPTPRPTAGCNNSCTVNADCTSSLVCDGGACRNPSCTDQIDCTCAVAATPTPTPVPQLVGCNNICTVNADCSGGLVCIEGACRNASCTEKTDCTCEIAEVPTPKVPVSGAGPSVLGVTVVGSALLFLLLGLAL